MQAESAHGDKAFRRKRKNEAAVKQIRMDGEKLRRAKIADCYVGEVNRIKWGDRIKLFL